MLTITLTFVIEIMNLTFITLPKLYLLEAQSDKKDIDRIKTAFASIANELAILSYDNAVWNSSYHFINNRNPNFPIDNFVLDTYKSTKINGIHIYDQQGSIVWGKTYDDNNWQEISFSAFDKPTTFVQNNIITPAKKIKTKLNKPITHTGFIILEEQLILFGATLINKANLQTKANGTMVFWRFLNKTVLADLQKRAGIDFAIELANLPNKLMINGSKNSYISGSYRNAENDIYDYIPLVNKKQILRFTYKAPTRQFEASWLNQSTLITFFSLSTTLLIVYCFIYYIIIKPIIEAKKLVREIIDDSNLSVRFSHKRKDELGSLFYLINRLLEDVSSKEQELISHNLRLQEISRTDGLTNIANRRAFDIYMNQLLSTSIKGAETSILVCDVDYFKKYNDFYGHALGDKALRLIAENFQRNLHSETDFVARYGGEEFVIVLKNTGETEAKSVANNLLASIRALNISHHKSDISDIVTISIGCHTFIASEHQEYTSLFEKADKALYLAKNLGRNRECSSSLLSHF